MPLSVARDIVQASVTAESDVHLQWAQRLVLGGQQIGGTYRSTRRGHVLILSTGLSFLRKRESKDVRLKIKVHGFPPSRE